MNKVSGKAILLALVLSSFVVGTVVGQNINWLFGKQLTSMQIQVAAPLCYARIEKAELSGKELIVEIDSNLVGSQDLRIKYNTEGPDERSQYYRILEARTITPANNTTTIQLKEYAEAATVWLYHTAGFKIDSCRVRRRPSIKDLETRLTQY